MKKKKKKTKDSAGENAIAFASVLFRVKSFKDSYEYG